ncbi:MAG: hypothetical protein KGD59_04290 [Candidatus Heimdallarchaeota archaeon]|nr:hypothetical protein [Candidatus Heimdallarchaeota archaeon]MBY8993745.1 hypothetical protein [Candidatus Heimdallarchaeota archaeon]
MDSDYQILMAAKREKLQKLLRILIWLVPVIVTITIGLCWAFYQERYDFFQEFISALGGRLSQEGHDNTTSSIIFTVGFAICGLDTLAIAIIYFLFPALRFNVAKGAFSLLLTIGAVGIAIPGINPTLHIIHGIGAFVFILGFTFFNFYAQIYRFVTKHRPKRPKRTWGFYADLVMTGLVFGAFLVFILFYVLERVASGNVPVYLAELGQKLLLIIDFTAVFFLDRVDM